MANEQQQTQPQVAIPLPKGKKNAVQIGCICMMLSVAMYGLVFATLTSPILESVNAMAPSPAMEINTFLAPISFNFPAYSMISTSVSS